MLGNKHIYRQSGWLRILISAALALTLAGNSQAQKNAPSALMCPSVARGATDETNTRVTTLQCLLRSQGYSLTVDGHYGNQTQEIVRRFQASHGLKATGVINGNTWRELIITLKPGSHGDAVRALQVTLREVSDIHLPLNGQFDAPTERAVRQFQKNNDLPINGIVGKVTWLHLTENIYD